MLACLCLYAHSALPQTAPKSAAVVVAAHDPADMPFRRAPIGLSSRSIVVSLATNLHLAWDAKLLRTHTVWEGEPLNLYGPPFNGTATKFVCDFTGVRLWGDAFAREPHGRFLALETTGGINSFRYELETRDASPLIVRETPRLERLANHSIVVRDFKLTGKEARATLSLHDEPGRLLKLEHWPNAVAIQRSNDVLVVAARGLPAQSLRAKEEAGPHRVVLQTERDGHGPYSAIVTNEFVGPVVVVWAEVGTAREFEILTVVCRDASDAEFVLRELHNLKVPDRAKPEPQMPPAFAAPADFRDSPAGDDFFRVEHFPIPKDIKLLVGGMDFLPNGDLAVCTYQGEVWIIERATSAPTQARWRRFARGLNEPGGLRVIGGKIYVTQKCELTRLTDTDGNGEADLFECISDGWGYTGNYHSFATGPALDAAGNFYVMITGHRTIYDVPFMGWCMKVTRSTERGTRNDELLSQRFATEGFCSGLRVPNGFGEFNGDIFMTDNQGHWIAANKLNHLQAGKYYGHPSASPAPREQFNGDANFAPPAVWFPYAWIRSASGIATIADERFGPFKGQMLVGEFQNASVFRVALEKVNGQWQGAVFPFVKGFASGVNRLAFGPDSKLYAGGLRMGHWTSIAPQPHSLDRVSFTGKMPFEIREVHARADGFELTFTQPVDAALAGDAENWDATQYTYAYDGKHNAPEKDRDEKILGPASRVTKAAVSADKLSVRLTVGGILLRNVVMVRALGVKNTEGKPLRNDTFHYTLNEVPKD